jgi:uncharacterized protein (DUF362 family)
MHEMDRRTFLLSTGRWLVLAGLAPTVSGCGRLLRWSDSQGGTVEDSEQAATSTSASTTTTGATGTTATSEVTTSVVGATTTTAAETTTTTAPVIPDLAVIRGESPDLMVRAAVAQLGGMERFVKQGAKVVVKPNVLTGRAPEYAVSTNPLVVSAIIRMCLEAGAAEVTVLDYPTTSARAAFQESGLEQATNEAGGTLKYLSSRNFETVDIPEGLAITSWPLVTDALEADTLINVPIPKTHGTSGLTMAMKNLMGIMGDPRGEIHTDFARKITDVNTVVKPHLVILDAYRVMVRHGPSGGSLSDVELRKMCVAGTSQVAIDAYGCTIMGWKPTDLPSLVEANSRGLGEIDLSKYNIVEGTS